MPLEHSPRAKKAIPAGVWTKCDKCEEIIYNKELEENFKICPKCGAPIIERMGRFGRFYACSKFPECKYTESIENKANGLNIKCPKCKKGDIVARKSKRGKIFYGCNSYPKCDFALWDKPVNEFCPKCDSILIEKGPKGHPKIKCSNKECDYAK